MTKIALQIFQVFTVIGAIITFMPTASAGYPLTSNIWRSNIITVCWEADDGSKESLKALIQQGVTETWERYSGVDFVGWKSCSREPNSGNAIRVGFKSSGNSSAKRIGQPIAGVPNGVTFNVNKTCKHAIQNRRNGCIKLLATHEFGHALGFTHEQNRPDRPTDWKARRCPRFLHDEQGTDGDLLIGGFDYNSVMSYCRSWTLRDDNTLSGGDKYMVRLFYGHRSLKPNVPFAAHTRTGLAENRNSDMLMADNGDLYIIKKTNTASRKTEVTILSGASGRKNVIFSGQTILNRTNSRWHFVLLNNPNNSKKDIAAITVDRNGTNTVEVHVLSADANYRAFKSQTGSPVRLKNIGRDEYHFMADENNDIVYVSREAYRHEGTPLNDDETKVLNQFACLLNPSACEQDSGSQSAPTYEWRLRGPKINILRADRGYRALRYNRDKDIAEGNAYVMASDGDIVVINTKDRVANNTLIAKVAKAHDYEATSTWFTTRLHKITSNNFDFSIDSAKRVAAIKKYSTGSGRIEVHLLKPFH